MEERVVGIPGRMTPTRIELNPSTRDFAARQRRRNEKNRAWQKYPDPEHPLLRPSEYLKQNMQSDHAWPCLPVPVVSLRMADLLQKKSHHASYRFATVKKFQKENQLLK